MSFCARNIAGADTVGSINLSYTGKTTDMKREQTVSTLMLFFLAMAKHPNVQAKAQAELDAVVGQDRLPECTDRGSLPYVNAVISELMRWQPVVPLGSEPLVTCIQI